MLSTTQSTGHSPASVTLHERHNAPPAPVNRAAMLLALAIVGGCAFLPLYATQPLLPMFRNVFHASELLVSLTVSAPVLAVAIAGPLVGMLADAIGRKRVIVAALIGLAIPTLLCATATSLPQLILWRFFQGLFLPGIIAVTMAYISEEAPAGHTGSTMATYVTGTVIGGFLGRFLSGLCASHTDWHMAFLLLGGITFAGAMVTIIGLPRSRRFIRQANSTASLGAVRSHLLNPQLLATYAVGFDVLFSLVGAFTYIGFHLAAEPFCLTPAMLGSLFFVYLIGAVITPIAGRGIDRVGYRRALILALAFAAAGILLTLITSLPMVIAGMAATCSGLFICQAAASSHVGKAAGHARSSAAGLYVACYYAGGFAGSVAPGMLWAHGGWPACVGLIVLMQALTAILAHYTWRQ